MKQTTIILTLAVSLFSAALAESPTPGEIIDRARATLGSNKALDSVFTLRMIGILEPADPKVPAATLLIVARKPHSQRLELRVGDMVETTILNGLNACIIRSNLKMDGSQMRKLSGAEHKRVLYSTRQLFKFYQPNFKEGEKVTYEGLVTHRGVRCHKLKYSDTDGLETIRYFSVADDALVASVSDSGVESVNRGAQVVNGIKYPTSIDYYEDGRKLHTIRVTEIFVNRPLQPEIFKIPQMTKK